MKKSVAAASLGAFVTIIFGGFWGLSWKGDGAIYGLPQGLPRTLGDSRLVIGIRIEGGSISLFRSYADNPEHHPTGSRFGGGFTAYSDLREWDPESYPPRKLSSLIIGKFACGAEGFDAAHELTFPFWLPTLISISGTLIAFWSQRRIESRMIQ